MQLLETLQFLLRELELTFEDLHDGGELLLLDADPHARTVALERRRGAGRGALVQFGELELGDLDVAAQFDASA